MNYRQTEAIVYARLLASALLVGASRHENGLIQDCAQPAAYLADAALGEWKKRYAKTLRNGNGDETTRELVEALELMLGAGAFHFTESGWPSMFHAGALSKARAAINKAKGE